MMAIQINAHIWWGRQSLKKHMFPLPFLFILFYIVSFRSYLSRAIWFKIHFKWQKNRNVVNDTLTWKWKWNIEQSGLILVDAFPYANTHLLAHTLKFGTIRHFSEKYQYRKCVHRVHRVRFAEKTNDACIVG